MWVIADGKWVLVPLQNWPVNLESESLFDCLSALASWVTIILAVMTPALLNLLPQRRISILMRILYPNKHHDPDFLVVPVPIFDTLPK